MRNALILLAGAILAGFAVYAHAGSDSLPTETAPKTGYLAPAFTLESMDGQVYEVGGSREKPLLLNFWASWCWPCEQEAPDLQRYYEKYEGQFDLYAVNLTKNDFIKNVRAFVNRFRLTFPVLLDQEGKVMELYRIQAIPTSFLIDRNGVIIDVFHFEESNDLEKKIKRLLKS